MSGWDPCGRPGWGAFFVLPEHSIVILSVSEGSQRWQGEYVPADALLGSLRGCPRLRLQYVSQTPAKSVTTDATDAFVTNMAGEFDFYALHHAYLCSKSHSVR